MQHPNMTCSTEELCPKHNCQKKYIMTRYNTLVYYCEKCSEEADIRAIEEDIQKKQIEQDKKEASLFKGIPKRFKNARLSDFSNIIPIIPFIDNPNGFLFVYGNCGTGKTHLSAAMQYYYNTNSVECSLIFSADLFIKLRNSFTKAEETEFEIIKAATAAHLVIFDDIGAQKLSDYAIEAWYGIIDARYRNESPTVFTSNLKLGEICKCMSDRIASRLASGIVFEMGGEDRRFKK